MPHPANNRFVLCVVQEPTLQHREILYVKCVLKVDSVNSLEAARNALNALLEHSPQTVQQRVLLAQEVGIPHTTRRLFVRYVLQVITPGVWMRVARCV